MLVKIEKKPIIRNFYYVDTKNGQKNTRGTVYCKKLTLYGKIDTEPSQTTTVACQAQGHQVQYYAFTIHAVLRFVGAE